VEASYKVMVDNLKEGGHFGDLDINGRVILKSLTDKMPVDWIHMA
jgi:hypothetical protein